MVKYCDKHGNYDDTKCPLCELKDMSRKFKKAVGYPPSESTNESNTSTNATDPE